MLRVRRSRDGQMTVMDSTAALLVVGILVLAALVAAAGGFDRTRRTRRRTVVRDVPVERVVERPVQRVVTERRPVVEERTTRRVVD